MIIGAALSPVSAQSAMTSQSNMLSTQMEDGTTCYMLLDGKLAMTHTPSDIRAMMKDARPMPGYMIIMMEGGKMIMMEDRKMSDGGMMSEMMMKK